MLLHIVILVSLANNLRVLCIKMYECVNVSKFKNMRDSQFLKAHIGGSLNSRVYEV